MLSYKKYFVFLLLLLSIGLNAAAPGQNPNFPQIATDSTGQYVYAIWRKATRIQVAISSDFGATFQNPRTTPASDGTPNLSAPGHNTNSPQITTDSTGQYVYAIWRLFEGGDRRIQVAISSDYGDTFQDPTTTPIANGTPNLSSPGQNSDEPQITTNNTGQYIYVVWYKKHGAEKRIQVAISSDYGDTFQDPTTTPASDGTPNLSSPDVSANIPQITTNSTGQYVYATWRILGGKDRVQAAISSDYGDTFQDPTTTSAGTPYLSSSTEDAEENQIATDSTGQYVYAIWRKPQGSKNAIRVSISSDYGDEFQETALYTELDIPPLGTTYELDYPVPLNLQHMTQQQYEGQIERIINHIKEKML